jgi:hypothetical protein
MIVPDISTKEIEVFQIYTSMVRKRCSLLSFNPEDGDDMVIRNVG